MPGSMNGPIRPRGSSERSLAAGEEESATSGYKVVEITDLPDGGLFFSKPYQNEAIATTFRELVSLV